MTVLDPRVPAGEPEPAGSGTSRPARRRLAAAALVVAVVAAVGSGGWWVTHPTALEPVGSRVDLPVPIGDSAVITMFAHPRSDDVRLLGAEPVIEQNSADATVRVLLCGNRTTEPGSTIIGAVAGRAEQVCATTEPVRESTLVRVGPTTPYLVVEVTPRVAGTVIVEGLRVRYREGVQRGEQDSGLVVTVRTSAGT